MQAAAGALLVSFVLLSGIFSSVPGEAGAVPLWTSWNTGILVEKALQATQLAWPKGPKDAIQVQDAREQISCQKREAQRRLARRTALQREAEEEYAQSIETATQAERMRDKLAHDEKEASPQMRRALSEARAALREDEDERKAGGGVQALVLARGILAQAVADRIVRKGGEGARQKGRGALRTSAESCMPHCAPEANVLASVDPTKYPWDESAGGHVWRRWRNLGDSDGVARAYDRAEAAGERTPETGRVSPQGGATASSQVLAASSRQIVPLRRGYILQGGKPVEENVFASPQHDPAQGFPLRQAPRKGACAGASGLMHLASRPGGSVWKGTQGRYSAVDPKGYYFNVLDAPAAVPDPVNVWDTGAVR